MNRKDAGGRPTSLPPANPADDHITLTVAAKIAPGRPSTNCLWRWCRRGVLARTGERIRLRHIRIGGKIFTTAAWLTEFGQRLAHADATYFDAKDQASRVLPPRDPKFGPPRDKSRLNPFGSASEETDQTAIVRELEDEGLS